jgi:hypothetical protein
MLCWIGLKMESAIFPSFLQLMLYHNIPSLYKHKRHYTFGYLCVESSARVLNYSDELLNSLMLGFEI